MVHDKLAVRHDRPPAVVTTYCWIARPPVSFGLRQDTSALVPLTFAFANCGALGFAVYRLGLEAADAGPDPTTLAAVTVNE